MEQLEFRQQAVLPSLERPAELSVAPGATQSEEFRLPVTSKSQPKFRLPVDGSVTHPRLPVIPSVDRQSEIRPAVSSTLPMTSSVVVVPVSALYLDEDQVGDSVGVRPKVFPVMKQGNENSVGQVNICERGDQGISDDMNIRASGSSRSSENNKEEQLRDKHSSFSFLATPARPTTSSVSELNLRSMPRVSRIRSSVNGSKINVIIRVKH